MTFNSSLPRPTYTQITRLTASTKKPQHRPAWPSPLTPPSPSVEEVGFPESATGEHFAESRQRGSSSPKPECQA